MAIDFIAEKLKHQLNQIDNPLEFEVMECLYEQYLAGEVAVQFIDGEAFFSLTGKPSGQQLELPLEC